MSLTFALDTLTHDITITQGRITQVYGAAEVRQRILVALLHLWEEYFLNVEAGVPWYELILGSKDKKMVGTLLRMNILSVPGVIGVEEFEVTIAGRVWSLYTKVSVTGLYGPELIIIDDFLSPVS